MRRLRLLCLIALSLASSLFAQSAWTVGRSNLPGVTSAHSVAFGNGRFVATFGGAASAANAGWSTDGVTWRPATSYVPSQGSVLFLDGMFYLASDGVWSSADGNTWQSVYMPTDTMSLRAMATNGRGLMIARANIFAKTLIFTADRLAWRETAPLPNTDAAGLRVSHGSVAYAFGRYYVAYSISGPSTGERMLDYVVSTVDGSEWTVVTGLFANARWLAAGNGRLVGATNDSQGTYATSSVDGITFTNATITGLTNFGELEFAGGRFFLTGSMNVSLDAQRWQPIAPVSYPASSYMFSIAYGNGRYVAVGYGGGFETIASLAAAAPPIVASPIGNRTIAEGMRASLAVTLENPSVTTTFQWRRDGTLLPGATSSTLFFEPARLSDNGIYTVTITNAAGAVTPEPIRLTVLEAALGGRIKNLSVLTSIEEATGLNATFSAGFVVGGTGTLGRKALLVRAAGPSLTGFGVAAPNADPALELFAGTQSVAINDNWGGGAALTQTFNRVGAFSFASPDSKDAAVAVDIGGGNNSVKISGARGATGTVITEIYDATPATEVTASTPRLLNVSVIKSIPAGGSLTAGFVIGGQTPRSVLIRVIGPGLAGFGTPSPVNNPRLAVYRSGAAVPFMSNDDWGGGTELVTAFGAVGAFTLEPGSRDAALLLTLEPGDYSVQGINPGPTAGTALIEIYEAP